MASHRWVVSDSNSVPGDPGPRVGHCIRPANLPWRQDLRTRLTIAGHNLDAERAQHAFNVAELESQVAILLKELGQARYELAQRRWVDAFPSQVLRQWCTRG